MWAVVIGIPADLHYIMWRGSKECMYVKKFNLAVLIIIWRRCIEKSSQQKLTARPRGGGK